MNNKGQLGVFIILIIVVGIIIGGIFIAQHFLNSGVSTDYPYSIEKNKIWSKLWLKDDHTTVYCYDDDSFTPTLEDAKERGKKVNVYYQEYILRGFFCSSGNGKIGTSIITKVEVLE